MKFVLVVLAVLVLLWLLKRSLGAGLRRPPADPAESAVSASAAPTPMLACAQCGVHLPRDEVLPGRGGVFCGEAHRRAFEQTHPGA